MSNDKQESVNPIYTKKYYDKDLCESHIVMQKFKDRYIAAEEKKKEKKSILSKQIKSSKSKISQHIRNLNNFMKLKFFTKRSKEKLCFIGVGGGGSNVLSDLCIIDDKHTYIHINSDKNALEQKQSKYKILLTSEAKKNTWGCGGDTDCGTSLIDEHVKATLQEYTKDYDTVYLIATLGGGVGSGSSAEIAEFLQSIEKKVMTYVTLPFDFEGMVRSAIAQDSLKVLKTYSDSFTVLDNNSLLESKKGLRETFKLASTNIYQEIIKLTN